MKAIAASILVLAGAQLLIAGTVAPRNSDALSLIGVLLGLAGLVLLAISWFKPNG
ncbi:MAG TPA: hypothetical protein VFE46_10325 [Pirellulales bacterium]|jgi:hypothetical protein|nr:hypothetical protein [Pirellulales bacterium]